MQQVDLLLTNGIVVTMNAQFEVFNPGAVAIAGDQIVAAGAQEELVQRYAGVESADCGGHVIIPGLVNAHTHVPMSLLRGLNDDLRLDVWLGYLMPVEREFVTPEFVRLGTRLACAEMLRSGVTSFADMYYYEDDIADETARIGMRALLGQTILMFPTPDSPSYEDGIELCRHFIERWQGHPLIQPAVSPHAWYTATPELLRACAELALAHDVPIHTHIAETSLEVENCRQLHNMPTVPWNRKHGILDARLLAAHCVHIDRGEMLMLKKAGAGVAHCPSSNLKLSSGIANIQEMLDVGLNVGIGTDGPASNNDLDMVEETRLAAFLGKVRHSDPTHIPARKAFEMATIGGARAIHMGHLTGSLEPGKRADLAIVRMDGLHNWPHFHNNPDSLYSRLVYAAHSADVQHVMCNGQWLMRDRVLLTIDEETVRRESADVATRIDAYVRERESSPYNKLIILAGAQREESFEVQVKVPVSAEQVAQVRAALQTGVSEVVEVTRFNHYRQFDHYFRFDGRDPDASRLRYRDDEILNEQGQLLHSRARLTLLGKKHHWQYPNAVILSRSRLIAPAGNSLRFYREYFAPESEMEIHKDRLRWRVLFHNTDFAINVDQVLQPALPQRYLEIKARTWSRRDAERKAAMIETLLDQLGLAGISAETREYAELALENG
jgi:5-methylthioadenosine/S-adenosylhomocysteine deaminase